MKAWLYGSRLDDDRRGGDIDLLIELICKASVMDKARIKFRLETALSMPVFMMTVAIDGEPSVFESIARAKAVLLSNMLTEELL